MWTKATTEDGRDYWFNRESGTSQWAQPDGWSEETTPEAELFTQHDSNGTAYYISTTTSVSTWTLPPGGVVVAAADSSSAESSDDASSAAGESSESESDEDDETTDTLAAAATLKEARVAKGMATPQRKRSLRMSKIGLAVMRHGFGVKSEKTVGSFTISSIGKKTVLKKASFLSEDKCAEFYRSNTLPDGDKWTDILRDCRAREISWTDPDFSPCPAGGVDTPAIGLTGEASKYRQVKWTRLSETFSEARWIELSIGGHDGSDRGSIIISKQSGQCVGYDPNLTKVPSLPPTTLDAETTKERVQFAHEHATKLMEALISYSCSGDSNFDGLGSLDFCTSAAEGLKSQMDHNMTLPFQSIGWVSCERASEERERKREGE